ncbi:hypothetical protein PPYR_00204 [Photinus pyralis]|uniref:PiggyBac transposable element-derived protein domain-containing protein n=1 Tax=Photinus pyralis TaxID=7054 RepID=A0A5N4B0X1_PHOPY|nr:hypothetical protein PPYR_00204 [Photinus pyralis]
MGKTRFSAAKQRKSMKQRMKQVNLRRWKEALDPATVTVICDNKADKCKEKCSSGTKNSNKFGENVQTISYITSSEIMKSDINECDNEEQSSDDSEAENGESEELSDEEQEVPDSEYSQLQDDEEPLSDYSDVEDQYIMTDPEEGSDSEVSCESEDMLVNRRTKRKRTRRENIIKELPGPKHEAKNLTNIQDIWQLFFTEEMINEIVEFTNVKIRSVQPNYAYRPRDARETDLLEIKAFIGLLFFAGSCYSNHRNVIDLWNNNGTGIEIFRLVQSKNRFHVNRHLRKSADKLYCIRGLFEQFVKKCKTYYSHGPYVTVDEMLPNFRGRCSFCVYMPTKPGKYGVKVWACCDAKTYYCSNLEVFIRNQPPGPYWIDSRSSEVVKRMVNHIERSGRNVTCDNLFTSVPLAKDLLEKKLTLVGTLRKNKREIPPMFIAKSVKRPLNSSMFGFTNECTLVSYKSKVSKMVLLLSTLHHDDAINPESGEAAKPEIIITYNSTKCGVDLNDALQKKYSVSRKANRWPLVIFYFLLNVSGVNSYVIYKENTVKKIRRQDFLASLCLSLVYEQGKRRVYETNIPQSMKLRLCELLKIEKNTVSVPKQQDVTEARCAFCPSKKNRKSKTLCSVCKRHICKEHTTVKCKECSAVETGHEHDSE